MRHRLRIGVSGAGEVMPLGCSRSSPRTPAEFGLQHPVCGRQAGKVANNVDAAQERATECHCDERHPAPCTSLCESHATDVWWNRPWWSAHGWLGAFDSQSDTRRLIPWSLGRRLRQVRPCSPTKIDFANRITADQSRSPLVAAISWWYDHQPVARAARSTATRLRCRAVADTIISGRVPDN